MSECERCLNDVVYPHTVQIGRQWVRVCDDCHEDISDEHARDLAEREYEQEAS